MRIVLTILCVSVFSLLWMVYFIYRSLRRFGRSFSDWHDTAPDERRRISREIVGELSEFEMFIFYGIMVICAPAMLIMLAVLHVLKMLVD